MNAYEKIRAALEIADRKTDVFDAAKAALAELEKASKEPVAWRSRHSLQERWILSDSPKSLWECQPLYTTPPPAPVAAPKFEAVEVTDEVCERVADAFERILPQLHPPGRKLDENDYARFYIAAVRAELGPTLGLVTREELAARVEAAYREGGFAGREGGEFNHRWLNSNARKQLESK